MRVALFLKFIALKFKLELLNLRHLTSLPMLEKDFESEQLKLVKFATSIPDLNTLNSYLLRNMNYDFKGNLSSNSVI